jgi:CBS domain-containing protein
VWAEALHPPRGAPLPVTDEDGRLVGVLTAEALAERLGDDDPGDDPAQWAEIRPTVTPEDTVAEALDVLERHSVHELPVVDGDGVVVGWFTPNAVLDGIRRDTAGA